MVKIRDRRQQLQRQALNMDTPAARGAIVRLKDLKASEEYQRTIRARLENPLGRTAPEFQLDEPGWHVRIVNTEMPHRLHRAIVDQGYLRVHVSEVQNPEMFGGLHTSPDGYVCFGEHGQEWLMKIPQDDYEAVQQAKVERNLRSQARTPEAIAQEAAGQFGPQAADYLARGRLTITDERSPVDLNELQQAPTTDRA